MSGATDDTVGNTDQFVFSSDNEGETFVRTLMEHRAWCYWCLAPLEVNPTVRFPDEPEGWPLETARTFRDYGEPVDVYPPGEKDETTVCGNCGELDFGVGYSRDTETMNQALEHILSILDENGTDVTPIVARATVNEYHDKGHTGQFVEVLGTAIYRSTG